MIHKLTGALLLMLSISTALFSLHTNAAAATWETVIQQGTHMAISPQYGMTLTMQPPRDGVWGAIELEISKEQVEALKKYRIDKYFTFVQVIIEIDGYQHAATAKIDEPNQLLRADLNGRIWDSLKKGEEMMLELPEGTRYIENLRGSSRALQTLERHVFN